MSDRGCPTAVGAAAEAIGGNGKKPPQSLNESQAGCNRLVAFLLGEVASVRIAGLAAPVGGVR